MTQRVLFRLCLFTSLSLPAAAPTAGPGSQGLRLFFCGHSCHFHVPTMLQAACLGDGDASSPQRHDRGIGLNIGKRA